jgi:hypothetical protein
VITKLLGLFPQLLFLSHSLFMIFMRLSGKGRPPAIRRGASA